MALQIRGAAKRLILSLMLACGAAGCAVYGPPYAPYGAPYGSTAGYSAYPAYSYDDGYSYGAPAYAYPPVTLGLGFSYYDRGPRHHGGHGWGNRHRGGHEWRGDRGGNRHQHRGHGRPRR